MQILKHLGAILVGILFGWQANDWLSSMPNKSNSSLSADHLATSQPNIDEEGKHHLNKNDKVSSTGAQQSEPPDGSSEQTPISLISELLEMDDSSFEQYLYQSNNIPKDLLFGVLLELPSISDLKSRYRLIDFVNSARLNALNEQNYDIEDWIVEKIRNNEQADYWLELASEFGLESKENVAYIAENLDKFPTSEARASALLALSKGLGFGFNIPSDDFNKNTASKLVAPYLSSESELVRAAAVRTLRQYPSKTFVNDIVKALNDDAEQVRLSAINSLGGFNTPDNDVLKSNLLARMQASDASEVERIMAWQKLKLLPRSEKHYRAIYDFGKNEVPRLSELLSNAAIEARTPWSL